MGADPTPAPSSALRWTLPNILSVARIALVPVLALLFLGENWLGVAGAAWAALAVFVLASLTDWVDGWLARRWGQESLFGRVIDPIADKLLVATALILLLATGRLDLVGMLAALVILLRELLVAGLREALAPLGLVLPVSALAKVKTAAQMLAVAVLLAAPGLPAAAMAPLVGTALLGLAALLTLITALAYVRAALAFMAATPGDAPVSEIEEGKVP